MTPEQIKEIVGSIHAAVSELNALPGGVRMPGPVWGIYHVRVVGGSVRTCPMYWQCQREEAHDRRN